MHTIAPAQYQHEYVLGLARQGRQGYISSVSTRSSRCLMLLTLTRLLNGSGAYSSIAIMYLLRAGGAGCGFSACGRRNCSVKQQSEALRVCQLRRPNALRRVGWRQECSRERGRGDGGRERDPKAVACTHSGVKRWRLFITLLRTIELHM